MYLTQTDIINWQLGESANMQMSDIIKELINDDIKSDVKKDMIDGHNYYKAEQDILKMDFRQFFIDGIANINKNASNNRIVNAYQRVLVDQKTGYIVGNPVAFNGDQQTIALINNMLRHPFYKTTCKLITGASNKGREYLHIYVNQQGQFDYVIIPAEQVIPIYDSAYLKELIGVVRYYPVTVKQTDLSPAKTLNKVEIWDNEKTYYFAEDNVGKYYPDPDVDINPKYHFYAYNTLWPEQKIQKSWGRVPFIELRNNDICQPDIKLTKSLIDNYDYDLSKYSNTLADVAKAIWVLKGYEGDNLGDFMRNLNTFNAIKVSNEGGVEPQKNDIPNTAHDSHMDRIEDNIFVFGMGVNPKIDKFGNSPSGISLKFMYAGLDLKANKLITEAKSSLMELMWFLSKYLELTGQKTFDYQKVEPVFNKSLLINESEIITSARDSKGIISDQTIIAHHPWVNDVNKELELLEKQNAGMIDLNAFQDGNGK